MESFGRLLLGATLVILVVAGFREFVIASTPPDPLADKIKRTPTQHNVAITRLITIWRLLYEARWVVASVMTIPIVFCFIGLHEVPPESAVRITGLFLQVLGLSLVFYQLVKLRQKFNKQSYFGLFLDWLQRLGRALRIGKPKHHNVSASDGLVVSCAVVSGELKSILNLNESQSLQEQIRYLADVLRNYDNNHEQRFINIREEFDTVKKDLSQLAVSERKSREDLAEVVETVSVGDHALELLGVFWLLVGVVLSTIPDSIYGFFS